MGTYTAITQDIDENAFEELVTLCIEAYKITFSDTTALDANGVLGKQRVMIMEDERYQRETKIIRAQKTIEDLREIEALTKEIEDEDEDEEDLEFDLDEEETLSDLDEIESFDIRNRDKSKKLLEKKKKEKAKTASEKPKKVFDKAKMDMRLKLIAQRREVLSSVKNEEEKEGDALNIFFIPVTREEFEKIGTVEVSTGVSTKANAFDATEEDEIAKKLKKKKEENGLTDGGSAFHYEEDENGDMVLVED